MLKKIVKTVHTLRIFFLFFIIISFMFLLGLNPVDISRFVGARIGSAVGMSISIPDNPFNKLALQLEKKEDQLALKEQELIEREKNFEINILADQNRLIIFLWGGIIILFILITTNYYLDYKRRRKSKE